MRLFTLSAVLATFLWSAPIGGIAVLVKNSPITLYDVELEMKQSGTSTALSVDNLIRKKLEQLEASEKKILVTSAEIDEEIGRMAAQNNLSKEQFLNTMLSTRALDERALRTKVEESIKGQKLYSSIAFSKISPPTAEEEREYYQLHLDDFSRPESFDVTTYISSSKEALTAKLNDPMREIGSVSSEDQTLLFEKINPQLAYLLNKTKEGSFTPVFPRGQNGFMSFYLRSKNNLLTESFESVRPQLTNMIMGDKRNQVLNDYFTRLRLNADIKIIRLPK